ncbi:TRAP transporter small permease [Pollutimonas subterranea]|uniref:TRAP transporter small permease n=1 Tax=Pollutimonas subterranea TaxID=2045210 RepID=UPI001E44CAEC|nr:TRAP transporter small permease [Pollutimonas subterranea]
MLVDDKSRAAVFAKKAGDVLHGVLAAVMAFSLLLMLILVFGNVVMRYVFNSGIMISEEVARMTFVWLIFIGSVLAFRAKQHLAVNMLVVRLPVKQQKVIHIVRQLLILAVLWLLIDGGWAQTVIGLSTVTPVAGVPIAIFSGAVWFCATAMALMILADLYVAIRAPAIPGNASKFLTSYDYVEDV